jgi:hypothetical protein
MSTYGTRQTKTREQSSGNRASAIACLTQIERAAAADRLRWLGFQRLFFFTTLGGFYCVEGLNNEDRPTRVPDDQAGE